MRIVNKQYSMESFISRLPGVYPAYKDGVLYYFDKPSLEKRGYEYPTNYGMIPLNLVFDEDYPPSAITINDEVENVLPCCDEDRCNDLNKIPCCDEEKHSGQTVMSWATLSDWYSFFKKYYELLNDCGHCKSTYTSATEYYDTESKDKFPEDLKYGSERTTYENFDELFNERGGKVIFVAVCIETSEIIKVTKEERYNYTINVDENNKKTYRIVNDSGEEEILSEEDFNKYLRADGVTDIGFYGWLNKNIISASTPTSVSSGVVKPNDCKKYIPKINDNINITISIDDMGQFSIFSNDYELGEAYTSGETIYIDNKSMYISAGTGYDYDDILKEMALNDTDWADYTDSYIGKYPELFCNNFEYYGFKENGEKVTGNTIEEVESALTEVYTTTPHSGICINGEIIDIQNDEYIIVKNNKGEDVTYYVYREKDTETPYVYFNGKKTYANLHVPSFTYRFTIASTDYETSALTRTKVADSFTKDHIKYDGGDYEVSANTVTIGDMVYDKVDGYFETDENTMFVISGTNKSSACTYSVMGLEWDDTYSGSSSGATFKKKPDNPIIYKTGYISGYTSSKLETLRSKNCLVDDIGTEINGMYDVGENMNYQPSEGEELDLLYQVGNTANIMPFSKTSGGTDLTVNYFIGDIITDMFFYYEDISGKKYSGGTSGTSLQRIDSIEDIPSGATLITENVLCDITYCMGATLERFSGGTFHIFEGGNSGVTYYETVEFEKHNEEYHLKSENKKATPIEKKDPSNHSVSYPVVCYGIKKKEEVIDGETKYIDNLARFETNTLWISGTSKNDIEIMNFTGSGETEDKNGMTVFPVFRQEYMLGSATMQNVDADIYIDRGINAAIDKHLKLGEVLTMEALENYNNGYFKIMQN